MRFALVIFALSVCALAQDAIVALEWDANHEPDFSFYEVTLFKDDQSFGTRTEVRDSTKVVLTLPVGYYRAEIVAVTTADLRSGPAPIMVQAFLPGSGIAPSSPVRFTQMHYFKIELQYGTDLLNWQTLHEETALADKTGFWRLKLSPTDPVTTLQKK